MCSILGIINFNGLTESDINHFRWMFLRAESRGRDAAGVATQNLNFRKWGKATSEAKKTLEFQDFLHQAKGQQWIIGHARAATQGDPSQAINNHPISVAKGKFLLVHNGMVGSTGIVSSDKRTDTYIIAKAIKQSWIDGDLFHTVQNAYKLFYGSAAIAVISHGEIVIAKRFNPIMRGRLPNGAIAFGSSAEIVKAGNKKVKNLHAIPDDHIIGYDSSGNLKTGKLEVVSRPSRFQSDWRSSSYHQGQTRIERFLGYTGFYRDEDEPKETTIWDWDKEIRGYKKNGKGKGWWREQKRHSKAAKLGHQKRRLRGKYYF